MTESQIGGSPHSLLWAFQLKREHAYLLERIDSLDAANAKQNERITTVNKEAEAHCTAKTHSITAQLDVLQRQADEQRQALVKIEREINEKLDAAARQLEPQQARLTLLEDYTLRAKEDTKTAFSREKDLLKRIADLEAAFESQSKRAEASCIGTNRSQHPSSLNLFPNHLDSRGKQDQVGENNGDPNYLAHDHRSGPLSSLSGNQSENRLSFRTQSTLRLESTNEVEPSTPSIQPTKNLSQCPPKPAPIRRTRLVTSLE